MLPFITIAIIIEKSSRQIYILARLQFAITSFALINKFLFELYLILFTHSNGSFPGALALYIDLYICVRPTHICVGWCVSTWVFLFYII